MPELTGCVKMEPLREASRVTPLFLSWFKENGNDIVCRGGCLNTILRSAIVVNVVATNERATDRVEEANDTVIGVESNLIVPDELVQGRLCGKTYVLSRRDQECLRSIASSFRHRRKLIAGGPGKAGSDQGHDEQANAYEKQRLFHQLTLPSRKWKRREAYTGIGVCQLRRMPKSFGLLLRQLQHQEDVRSYLIRLRAIR